MTEDQKVIHAMLILLGDQVIGAYVEGTATLPENVQNMCDSLIKYTALSLRTPEEEAFLSCMIESAQSVIKEMEIPV